MKIKLFYLIAFMILSIESYAQSCGGPIIQLNTFDNSQIPLGFTVIDVDQNTPSNSQLSAGITGAWQPRSHNGHQCMMSSSNGPSNDWLITPAMNLGSGPICLSWAASGFYSFYTENYEVRISHTGSLADFLANSPVSSIVAENNEWTEHAVDLSAYANSTIYIAFRVTSTNGRYLWLDDINVSTPVNLDTKISSITLKEIELPGVKMIEGRLLNSGLTTINSLNINWKELNGNVNTTYLSGLNILPYTYYDFSHSINWNANIIGTYTLKVWANSLNGFPDQFPQNDTLTQISFINNFPRKPLIEEFTSANCPPCAAGNPQFDGYVQPNISANKITSIKYHTPWPGNNEPMNMFNNSDVMDRVNQYGIAAVPMAVNDGKLVKDDCTQFQGSILCLDQFDIDSLAQIPSIFDLRVSLINSSSNATINVIATAKADIPLTGLKLFTVLIEDTIDYAGVPPGSNGEYEFTQVMRNFLPDINGESIPTLTNNQSISFSYNYLILPDIDPTMLKAVTFVQDISKGTVYQSANSDFMTGIDENNNDVSIHIAPNPANDFINVEMENSVNGISEIELYDLLGNKVFSKNIMNNTTSKISIVDLSMGIYICRITNNGKTYKTEKLSIIK